MHRWPIISALRGRFVLLALPLLSLAVGLGLYRGVIALPFYQDDLVILRALSHQSLAEVWWSSPMLPYYRPLSYFPWKLMQAVGGRADPVIAHALVFGGHVLNTVLVGLLARWLTPASRRAGTGVVAALLFAVFPFSYQVVTWASSITHILTTAGALGAALTALRWRRDGGWWPLPLLWICAFVGIFPHENGVLVLPLVVLALLVDGWPGWRRFALAAGPVALLVIWFFISWLAAPKAIDALGFTFGGVMMNLAYFAQGLSHPISLAGGWLVRQGANDLVMALGTGVLGLIVLGAGCWRWNRRGGVFALLWYAIGIAPSTFLLDFAYVIDGPRLMYLSAVGAALAWAFVWRGVIDWGSAHRARWRPWLSLALAGVAVVATAALGVAFVRGRMVFCDSLSTLYWAVSRETVAIDRRVDGRAVFVNAPKWLAYRQPTYPLGHEGVIFLEDYMGLRDLIWANTGAEVDISTLAVGDLASPISYWMGVRGPEAGVDQLRAEVAGAAAVYYAVAMDDALTLQGAWRRPAPVGEPVARFANGMTLLDGAATATEGRPLRLRVELAWHATRPVAETVFVHVFCEAALVAQADSPLRGGPHPFAGWPVGEAWREFRQVVAPADAPADCLRVQVGLYDGGTGQRTAAHDPAGNAFADDAIVLPLDLAASEAR